VGHSESPGVWTSIEGWGAAIEEEEESRTCMRLAAGNLWNWGFCLEDICKYMDDMKPRSV
jgi:hypothetical protein